MTRGGREAATQASRRYVEELATTPAPMPLECELEQERLTAI
jgi:hypothetical protein